MLFGGREVRIVKNCDRGLENAAAYSFFPSSQTKKKTLTEKDSRKRYCDRGQIGKSGRAKNQSDCRIRCRARLEKNKYACKCYS